MEGENCKPLTTNTREKWMETVTEALTFPISETTSPMKMFLLCRSAFIITLKPSLAQEVMVADKGKHWI